MIYAETAVALTVLILSLICAVNDIKKRTIPLIPLLAIPAVRLIFIAVSLICGYESFGDAAMYFAGAAAAFVLMFVSALIMKDGVGGGDIKLMAALGFAFGWEGLITLLFFTFLPAAVFGIAVLVSRKGNLKTGLPMAPFAAFGTLAVCLLRALENFGGVL